jgi:nicotinamidase-related amidase
MLRDDSQRPDMTILDFKPRSSALVLLDLMPRILKLPTAPYSGPEVLQRCLLLAAAMRSAGGLVVFVRVERPGVDVQPSGSGLAAECNRQPGDVEIVKRTLGAFQDTGLDPALKARRRKTVVLGGLVTNWAVESTGRIADELGYQTVFVSDAMSGLHEHAHRFAVEYVFPKVGTVCTTAELLAQLRLNRRTAAPPHGR